MKTKILRLAFVMLAAFHLASCGSDEPQWADAEAHEKTEQLRAQYTPFIVGTWHIERIGDKQRAFEQLTFYADGTLSGLRKWQSRQVVTVDGEEQYTDWEDVPDMNGTFKGTWKLVWERNMSGVGENRLTILADWDDETNPVIAYSHNPLFGYADETTLQFAGHWQDSDGWTIYNVARQHRVSNHNNQRTMNKQTIITALLALVALVANTQQRFTQPRTCCTCECEVWK